MALPDLFPDSVLAGVGIVVIGRNEGARLVRCLASVRSAGVPLVYVDSGSSDGSAQTARRMGVDVVELDLSRPFCAARARNAGYTRLVDRHAALTHVQFIDGDCELIRSWLLVAHGMLKARPALAIVAGWLRERTPHASIYNRLAEFEWNPSGAGEVSAVGGIFMIRRTAFEAAGGFNEAIAAGEEPELCQRLLAQGWRVLRMDREMARHDLAMTRFGQWWKRMTRSGYTSLQGGLIFANPDNRRANWRTWFWAAWSVAVLCLSALLPDDQLGWLAVLMLWPMQWLRIALRTWGKGHHWRVSLAHAFFLQIAFLPQLFGHALYFFDRWRHRSQRLLEYRKNPTPVAEHRE